MEIVEIPTLSRLSRHNTKVNIITRIELSFGTKGKLLGMDKQISQLTVVVIEMKENIRFRSNLIQPFQINAQELFNFNTFSSFFSMLGSGRDL